VLNPATPVPDVLRHERFVALPLSTEHAALDHAAYTASPDVIRVHSDGRWPTEGFTLEDDLELLVRHEAEHEGRRSFAFLLLTPSQDEAVGCLYVNPLRAHGLAHPAAMVTFWLRQDLQESGLADAVVAAVDDWLTSDWPVATHYFRVLPGERSSRAALDRLLPRVDLDVPGETRPYLWYGSPRSASTRG
jgi:RimJ/RimL family protein N-acetyltransferase